MVVFGCWFNVIMGSTVTHRIVRFLQIGPDPCPYRSDSLNILYPYRADVVCRCMLAINTAVFLEQCMICRCSVLCTNTFPTLQWLLWRPHFALDIPESDVVGPFKVLDYFSMYSLFGDYQGPGKRKVQRSIAMAF